MNANLMPIEIQEKIIEFLPFESQLNLSRHLINNKIDSGNLNWNSDEIKLLDEKSLIKYVKCLLLKKVEIDVSIAFKAACIFNYLEAIKYLSSLILNNKGFPNEKYDDDSIYMCFDIVIGSGNLNTLKYMCETFDESFDDYQLNSAIKNNRVDIVNYLINERNVYYEYDEVLCASRNGNLEIFKILIDNSDVFNEELEDYLVESATFGHLEIVEYLFCEHNIGWDDHAVICAAQGGHLEVLKFLCRYYVIYDLNEGLIESARNGYFEIVKYLLEIKGQQYSIEYAHSVAKNIEIKKLIKKYKIENVN